MGRRRRPRLSILCLTTSPLSRTTAVLETFRHVADEFVCAVDARVPRSELTALSGRVDVLRRFNFDPSHGAERHLPWLLSLCSGEWIMRIDNDEVPSAGLLREIPELMETTTFLQYFLPRYWVYPDSEHFIDEAPWSGEWHVRLARNHPNALQAPGTLHTNINGCEPLKYVNMPFYHLDCVLSSYEARVAKAANYEEALPGIECSPGFSVNNLYLPERYQNEPSSPLPPEDAQIIAGVLHASDPRQRLSSRIKRLLRFRDPAIEVTPNEESDRHWPPRQVAADAYRASWLWVTPVKDLDAGYLTRVYVEVRNDGSETWPHGNRLPAFRLSYRWLSGDLTSVLAEGSARTHFTSDVPPGATIGQHVGIAGPEEPGEYMLQFALVHEDVRWFAEGPVFPVTVKVSSTRRQDAERNSCVI